METFNTTLENIKQNRYFLQKVNQELKLLILHLII